MNSQLTKIHAEDMNRQARATVASRGPRHLGRRAQAKAASGEFVVRQATPADAPEVLRLAELEGMPLPAGEMLLAFDEGTERPLAALPIGTGPALADPFRPSANAVAALREARAHLRGERPPSRGRRIGAALGKLFSPTPGSGSRAPAVPGGEGRLIR